MVVTLALGYVMKATKMCKIIKNKEQKIKNNLGVLSKFKSIQNVGLAKANATKNMPTV